MDVKVDGMTPQAYLHSVVAANPENEDIAALNLQLLVVEADKLTGMLQRVSDGVASWKTPVTEYAASLKQVVEGDAACSTYLTKVGKLQVVISGIQKHSAAEEDEQRQEDVKARDAISRGLRAGNVPASLAKPLADHVIATTCERHLHESTAFGLAPGTALTTETWKQPVVIEYFDEAVEDETVMHAEVRRYYDCMKDIVTAKFREKIPAMKEMKDPKMGLATTHYHVAVTPPENGAFQFNCGGSEFFKDVPTTPLLHVLKHLDFDARIESLPLRTQRSLYTVTNNACAVVLADASQVIGTPDFHTMVANAHHTYVGEKQCMALCPGDSFIVPLNVVPCIIGLPFDPKARVPIFPGTRQTKPKDEEPYSAFLVQALFDSSMDLGHSPDATSNATQNFIAASRKLPTSIRSNKGVESWRAALESRADNVHDA